MTSSAAPVRWGLIALAYAGLILYGSLFPFVGWTDGGVQLFAFLKVDWPRRLFTADVVTNVLAYVPLGFFLARFFGARGVSAAAAVGATVVGAALSFGVEFLQQFLPGRTASSLDLATNTVGTLVGAALSSPLRSDGRLGRRLQQWRNQWFVPGRMADLGLVAIGLWALSQLTPLVPSLDIGNLRHGIAPLWHTLLQPTQFKTRIQAGPRSFRSRCSLLPYWC
jgi:VanZ family protein